MLNDAMISAFAALSGSALGGITPIVSNYLTQRALTERELLNKQLADRQALYSDFIRFGTKLYADATTRGPQEETLDEIISLYALVSRIRLCASAPVIEAAENLATVITEQYGKPAVSIEDLKNAARQHHFDPLNLFSNCCRDELGNIFHKGELR